ncbi:MAG: hypothetical protein WC863_01660 [Patescibacteria group bacterium]
MLRKEITFLKANEKEVTNETAALIGELSTFGEKNGNHLKFKEAGLSGDFRKLSAETKIKPEIIKGVSEKNVELLHDIVEVFMSFVTAPIFTDDFGMDHAPRQAWEKRVGLRNGDDCLSPAAKKYYHSNRLGFNRCFSVVKLMSDVTKMILDPEWHACFQKLEEKIPLEFLEKDENNNFKYDGLDDPEKIKVVEKLSTVVRDEIFLLKA